ncbi:MAG: hypothetical protein ACE5NJ_00695, partial [Thermodesulfobacteriota bacterium]
VTKDAAQRRSWTFYEAINFIHAKSSFILSSPAVRSYFPGLLLICALARSYSNLISFLSINFLMNAVAFVPHALMSLGPFTDLLGMGG